MSDLFRLTNAQMARIAPFSQSHTASPVLVTMLFWSRVYLRSRVNPVQKLYALIGERAHEGSSLDEVRKHRALQTKPEDLGMSERFYLPGVIVSAFVFAAIGIDRFLLMILGGWSLKEAGLTLCALILSALSAHAAIRLWRTGRW